MTIGIPPLRNWQETARDKILRGWQINPSAKALVAACPGSGKTLLTSTLIRILFGNDEIDLGVVLAPTTNIQLAWVDNFTATGIKATADASNFNLRWRKEAGVSMTEDNQVLVLTYAQLAKEPELIAEMARRARRALVVGDEIHHADDEEKFGTAVQLLAEQCIRSLALSGTPFNSVGGALALCDSELDVDPATGETIRRTLATHTYDYGEAIVAHVCRPIEFIKVSGRGEATYRLLSNNELFKKITDLARRNKSDSISTLLDPEGEFMEECARQAIRALADIRAAGDKRAAMLVVARNKTHGAQMARLLRRICEAEKQSFFAQEIYNDTPKAHDRIEDLNTDTTDIIISVRMVSEGVDIRRLRVGLFATDWMTRMFFIQFVGRFARYEDRLDNTQFARVIIPAHIILLKYAQEIEAMIESAAIVDPEEGPPGPDVDKTSEFVDNATEANGAGIIFRGEESEKIDLAEALYRAAPSARGQIPHHVAIKVAEEMHLDGASPDKPCRPKVDWSNRNDLLVRAVVKRLKANGESDDNLWERVQGRANRAVGIKKKDSLTAEDTLIKRHTFLQNWLKRLVLGQGDQENA